MKDIDDAVSFARQGIRWCLGHLCPGRIVGMRKAMLGCRLIGLDEPTHKDLIKKFVNSEMMAAAFLHLETGKRE